MKRKFHTFCWKNAQYKISSSSKYLPIIKNELKKQRQLLEQYIATHPTFQTTLHPIPLQDNAPQIAKQMSQAANQVGVGPMAAVAGTMAQIAAQKALSLGATEIIIENGGDIYLASQHPINIGIYAGEQNPLSHRLAFQLVPQDLPIAICSSSSTMGHSLSLGNCDLVTIIAQNASLADAAATYACNQIKSKNDINPTLQQICQIPNIQGILIIKDDKIGLNGNLPPIIKNADQQLTTKITHHPNSNLKTTKQPK